MSEPALEPPLIEARAACYEVPRTRILDTVDLPVWRGEMVAIVGPNGSGKTTLLRLMAGIRPASSGSVLLDGRPIGRSSRTAIARRLSYLPQETWAGFDITVRDAVAMGRFVHLGAFRAMGPADLTAVRAAMERMDLLALSERPLPVLSGGERQRVFLARALAQKSEILVLDEPTAALDIGHQLQLMATLRELNGEGQTIVCAMHDLQLVWDFFPDAQLLERGRAHPRGRARDVLTSTAAQEAFGVVAETDADGDELRYRLP